jgi:hypothetical protein
MLEGFVVVATTSLAFRYLDETFRKLEPAQMKKESRNVLDRISKSKKSK